MGDSLTCQRAPCSDPAIIGAYCAPHAFDRYRKTMQHRPELPDRYGPTEYTECAFDGCTRAAVKNALCGRHASQKARTGRLTALPHNRAPGAAQRRDEDGRKECGMCLRWLDTGCYGSSKLYPDGLQPYCTTCSTAARYGLSWEQLEARRTAADGRCSLCGEPNPNGRQLSVDHDHACCPGGRSCGRCVRDLLCSKCNTGLGMFRDSPELLGKAIAYLEKYATKDFRVEATVPANGAVSPPP